MIENIYKKKCTRTLKADNEPQVLLPHLDHLLSRRDLFGVAGILGAMMALSLAPGAQKTAFAQAREGVVLRLGWLPTGTEAPLYLTKEKGYWSKRGLDVDIRPGTGSGDAAKLVGLARDEFGNLHIPTVLISRSKGIPVKVLGTHYAENPECIISLKEKGIKTPKDLVGKAIGLSAGGGDRQLFPAFLKLNGVDVKDVKIRTTPLETRYTLLLKGDVDAAHGYTVQNLMALKHQGYTEGKELNVIRYRDWGFDKFYIYGITSSDEIVQKKRSIVQGFVDGFYEGLLYSIRNPEEAVVSMHKKFPEMNKALLMDQQALSFTLMDNKEAREHTLGWMDKERWIWMQDMLFDAGMIEKKISVEECYTNEFLKGSPFKG